MQENRALDRRQRTSNPAADDTSPRRSAHPFVISFCIMLGLWIILSGRFDLFHLLLGIISSAIVAWFSGDLLFGSSRPKRLLGSWAGFIRYAPWLLYQIFLANLHLIYLAFHPKMMDLIDPKIIRFDSKLKTDLALATFANSITLTPGTITIYVSIDGGFRVHAIDEHSGEGLPGEMEERIARAFGET